jgi:UDPglucose 6-dehydrogenase
MKIGIIGKGVVGSAIGMAFTVKGYQVAYHDTDSARSDSTANRVLEFADITFICLPTPQKRGSLECDLSAIHWFFQNHLSGSRSNLVLKSTVPIGTTRQLVKQYDTPNLVHSPEFLSVATAEQDALYPKRNIIGTPNDHVDNGCSKLLFKLYDECYQGTTTFLMSSDESEAVKLFQNSFSAVKIACFNEFYSLCEKLKLDWQEVRMALLAGEWITPWHTEVPGPDGKYGFGGACLPKDLANLIDCMEKVDVDRVVCASALTYRNDR